MATFKFGRTVDIHWNGYDIQGPADTVFSIPDQLYEEFDADISPVEPTLVWLDTNEFQTLSNSVSVTTLTGTIPISVTTTTSGKVVSISSTTNPAGYTLVADGTGGVIFQAGSTGALTSVVGISPISSVISGNTASVSIDQALLSVADASTATTLRTYVKNGSGSTINKGSAVYVTGSDGTNALIGLASASADPTSSKTLGILASTLTNNGFGYVIENGQLSNIDTSAASSGSSVWLGATPGSLVFDNPPAEPNHAVYLGVVTKANVSTGEVLVKVQNGYELDELHDVFVGGVSTALPLVYNSTSSGWIAQALTSVGIADNAIVGSKIIDGAVTSGKIADGSVTSAKIAAGAVGSAALGTGAVVSASIATGAVNSSILADNAVVAAKINAGSVGTAKIDSGAATSGQVLTANGSGGASFSTTSVSGTIVTETLTGTGTWTVPSGVKYFDLVVIGGGGGGGSGGLILSSAATTIANGGNSGSTPGSLFIPYYPVGSSTSFSYSVATGGAGGASVSATKAAGVTYAQILTTGNSGSAASGATTFGSRISVGAGAGGVGGGAYAAATGTAQSANATTASTTAFVSYNAITATIANGQLGQTDGATANNATNATLTQYPSLTISSTAVFPLVPTIGLLGDQSVASQSGSVTISGPGTFVTAVGLGASYDTTAAGVFGRGAGGASAIAKNAAAAGNGETGEAQSGCSGGAVAVRISSGATTATSITATAASGTSAVGYGASGAGGSGTAFSYATTTLATDSSYTASSGAGGNGSNGVIVIRYIK